MALAQQLLSSGRGVNGSAFLISGMNSSDDPMFIDDRSYFTSMNTVNRGGIVQSRPGYQCLFELPEGNLQGLCFFRPLNSEPYLVFVVEGVVYTSKYPFRAYHVMKHVQFYRSAPQIYWAVCVKSVEQNADGTLTIIDPVRYLVMQDGGYSKAAYWNGETSAHSDPAATGIPLGGPMAWSGDRLWVARKNQLFAGDINDPLRFTETTYLAEGGSLFMAEDITAVADIPGLATAQLAVFTNGYADVVQSGVRDRSVWKTLTSPVFQAVLFPNVGCVSQRSLVSMGGKLWWMTSSGLTSFDSAQAAFVTSVQAPQDIEMASSKGNMSPNIHQVCGAAFENYGLFSVPSGGKENRHTWVLDKAVLAGVGKAPQQSWNSVWTGTNPREWAVGKCAGVERIFHVSKAADGTNSLWEAFTADRLDNGQPITSYLETKTHNDFSPKATGLDLKRFLFAEVSFCEMFGNVQAAVYWAGTRGRYKKIAEWNFVATPGQLQEGVVIAEGETVFGYRPQSRVVRTPEFNPDKLDGNEDSACGAESDRQDHIDVGFSLLIVWSGRAAVRAYRIFVDPEQESGTGACVADETGETNIVKDALVETTL